MDRRGADRTSEAARRRLELLARELSRLDPPAQERGEQDEDEVDDLFAEPAYDEGHEPAVPARHRAGAAVTASRWGADAADRLPTRLCSVLGHGTTPSHVVVVLVVVLLAGGAVLWWVERAQPEVVTAEPAALSSPVAGSSPAAPTDPALLTLPTATTPAEVVVDVAGKVRRPGIVTLPVGSRVVDALEAAGGARRGAELTSLNLARVLVDGEQIVVGLPAVSVPSVPAPGGGSPGAPGGAVVNLNTATLDELDTLPQVGPVTAQAILAWRTDHGRFTSVDELLEVDGIGEATLAKLRPLVTV